MSHPDRRSTFPVLRVPGPFGARALSSGIAGQAIRARHMAGKKEAYELQRPVRSSSRTRRHLVVAVSLRRLRVARAGKGRIPSSVLDALERESSRGCGACLAVLDLIARNVRSGRLRACERRRPHPIGTSVTDDSDGRNRNDTKLRRRTSNE